jgi:hypothetical protein
MTTPFPGECPKRKTLMLTFFAIWKYADYNNNSQGGYGQYNPYGGQQQNNAYGGQQQGYGQAPYQQANNMEQGNGSYGRSRHSLRSRIYL